jgi:hypothetical protein
VHRALEAHARRPRTLQESWKIQEARRLHYPRAEDDMRRLTTIFCVGSIVACGQAAPPETTADDESEIDGVDPGQHIMCFGGTDGSHLGQGVDAKKANARKTAAAQAISKCEAACPQGGTCDQPAPRDALCFRQDDGSHLCEVCAQCNVPVLEVVSCHDVDQTEVQQRFDFAVHADGTFRGEHGAFIRLAVFHGAGTISTDGGSRVYTLAQDANDHFVLRVASGGQVGGQFAATAAGVLGGGAFADATLVCSISPSTK